MNRLREEVKELIMDGLIDADNTLSQMENDRDHILVTETSQTKEKLNKLKDLSRQLRKSVVEEDNFSELQKGEVTLNIKEIIIEIATGIKNYSSQIPNDKSLKTLEEYEKVLAEYSFIDEIFGN